MCSLLGRTPASFTKKLIVRFENVYMIGCKKGVNYAIRTGTGWPAGSEITIYNPPVEFDSTGLAPYDMAGNYSTAGNTVTGPYKGVIMGRGADGDCAPRECCGCYVWSRWSPYYACDNAEKVTELCSGGCSGTPGDAIWLDAGSGLARVYIENEGVIAGGGASFIGGGDPNGNAGGGGFPGGKGTVGSKVAAYGSGYSCWSFQNSDWSGGYQGARSWNRAYNTTAGYGGGPGNYGSGTPGYALKANGIPYTWKTGSSPAGRPYYGPVGGGTGRNDPFSPTVQRNGLTQA